MFTLEGYSSTRKMVRAALAGKGAGKKVRKINRLTPSDVEVIRFYFKPFKIEPKLS
jgi:hypothetical protein